jgi:hypothetical protein
MRHAPQTARAAASGEFVGSATYGDRRVTARLRVMLEQLGHKRGWSNLLAHNRFDCESAARMSKLSVSARNAA